jgi:hypothetical protein
MLEGMKLFTNHTNVWKKNKEEEKLLFDKARPVDVRELSKFIPDTSWKQVRGKQSERKYMPDLPKPSTKDPQRQIRFSRKIQDIRIVSNYLFEDSDFSPSEVGAECFDCILMEAKEAK